MITVEKIQSLDGTISIPTSQLLYFKNNKIVTGGGATITLTGASSGGTGGETGGGTGPTPTEVQDTTLEYTPLAIDSAINNTIEITQDSGQSPFSKFQFALTQQEFTLTAGTTSAMELTKIQMNVNSAGYQLCKILMYDENDAMITFNRVDADTVQKTSNNTIKIDTVSSGFTLVTNATYELANIFNTDKLPVAATGGWYALTSNTDATANFTATFSAPVTVAKVRIYRCGAASASFNGGSTDYTVKFTDANTSVITVNVPKVADAQFTGIANPTLANLGSSGEAPTIESKVKRFTLGVSTDGITFTDITADGVITTAQNQTTLAYTATETFPQRTLSTASPKLYFKIPDADIPMLKNVKVSMWRIDNI